jgi:UDP-glucose 6-dehydrogenase
MPRNGDGMLFFPGRSAAATSTDAVLPSRGWPYKLNSDDLREAPSRTLLADLFAAVATATTYDPVAMETARRVCGERGD